MIKHFLTRDFQSQKVIWLFAGLFSVGFTILFFFDISPEVLPLLMGPALNSVVQLV